MRSGASLTPRVLDHVLRAAENGTVEGEGDTALLGLTVHPRERGGIVRRASAPLPGGRQSRARTLTRPRGAFKQQTRRLVEKPMALV